MKREEALAYYDLFPFHDHPLWVAIINGGLSAEQVLKAEVQHYLRSEIGKIFREHSAVAAKHLDDTIYELLHQTVVEECYGTDGGQSHAELIKQFLLANGVTSSDLRTAVSTPGNIAAIALYKSIADRGPLHHMIGAGCVEFYYSKLCPKIYDAYLNTYRFQPGSFETYQLHGPMDEVHGERALETLGSPLAQALSKELGLAIRDAFVATSLHYDGMLQAATGANTYWNGK
ncbi:iron-containing redox enzyme family protein [Rhizobium sp. SAFR-030]|uniref:iron-containing redox enzyme family protein n=1 Tax=Rhizobium sp. SAFR-030 TaxID=3387277 RepID=UPI003F7E70A5